MLNMIKDRPLMFFILSFFFGMILSPLLPFSANAALTVLLLTVVLVTLSQPRPLLGKTRKIMILIPILVGIIFGTVFQYFAIEKPKNEITSLSGTEKEIVAVVEEVSFSEEYFVAYKVRVVRIDNEKVGFSCALSIPYDIGAKENDVIRLKARLSLPEKESYGFSLREYYSSRGIYLLAEATDENARVIGIDRSIPSFFRSMSHSLSVKLKTSLGREQGGFVSGLIIGRKNDVPDSVNTSFRYLGISHVLSVSGLHLAILTGTLLMLLKALTVRRSVRYLITVGFVIFFILLTGARPSVIRSGVMLILLMTADIIGRDYDPMTSLSIAAFVIIIFSPTSVYDAGFILSISATAGIILLGAPITRWLYHISDGKSFWLRAFTRLLTVLSITASATVFTLPAIRYFFGEASSVSLLSNILFIPLITVLMYLSILFLIFYPTLLAPPLSGITASMSKLITDLSSGLMRILPPPIDLTYPFSAVTVITAVTVLIVLLIKKKRALALVLSISAFATCHFGCLAYYDHLHKGEESIIYSSVNGNDYVIVNVNNKTLLCDFSDGGFSSLRRATELVRPKLHDTSVDTVLLTHLHRKHIAMISRLSDNERIKQLYIPSPQNDDEKVFAEAIRNAAEGRGIKVIIFNSESDITFDFSGIKITLYQKAYIERSVQPLHLMKIDGKRDFLYIGSAVFESELSEKAISLLESTDVLFLGAHGPLIKKPLIPLVFEGEVLISDSETNIGYETNYKTVEFFKKYITK